VLNFVFPIQWNRIFFLKFRNEAFDIFLSSLWCYSFWRSCREKDAAFLFRLVVFVFFLCSKRLLENYCISWWINFKKSYCYSLGKIVTDNKWSNFCHLTSEADASELSVFWIWVLVLVLNSCFCSKSLKLSPFFFSNVGNYELEASGTLTLSTAMFSFQVSGSAGNAMLLISTNEISCDIFSSTVIQRKILLVPSVLKNLRGAIMCIVILNWVIKEIGKTLRITFEL